MSISVSEWRRAMAAGVLFVVLFVVGVMVSFANSPEIKKKDSAADAAAKYTKFLSDSGHRVGLVIGAYALVLAGLAFIWFTQALRSSLGTESISSRVVSSLGVLGAAAMSLGGIFSASAAGAKEFGDEALPNGDTMRAISDIMAPCLLVIFGLLCALLAAILALGLMRAGTMPKWIAYTAWIAVLGGLGGVFFLPLILVLLWFLAFAIVGLVRPPAAITGYRNESQAAV